MGILSLFNNLNLKNKNDGILDSSTGFISRDQNGKEIARIALAGVEEAKSYSYIDQDKVSKTLNPSKGNKFILIEILAKNTGMGKPGLIDNDSFVLSSGELALIDSEGQKYFPLVFKEIDTVKNLPGIGLSLNESMKFKVLFEVDKKSKDFKLRYGWDEKFGFKNAFVYWKLE